MFTLTDLTMQVNNDFFRKASLFTMNGMADPRMMPGYKTDTKSTTSLRKNDSSPLYSRLLLRLFNVMNIAR